MYIALIWSEESWPWYVMKLSEMLTKIVMIFSEMLTYDCHGCLWYSERYSLPYTCLETSKTLSIIFMQLSEMLTYYKSWNSVRCSSSLSWYQWDAYLHRKKRFTSFPSPAGMSLTKLPLGRNNSVMTSLFPPRESLVVVTSRLGTGNSRSFFLRCMMICHETQWDTYT